LRITLTAVATVHIVRTTVYMTWCPWESSIEFAVENMQQSDFLYVCMYDVYCSMNRHESSDNENK
jgi:hypothetical protein